MQEIEWMAQVLSVCHETFGVCILCCAATTASLAPFDWHGVDKLHSWALELSLIHCITNSIQKRVGARMHRRDIEEGRAIAMHQEEEKKFERKEKGEMK